MCRLGSRYQDWPGFSSVNRLKLEYKVSNGHKGKSSWPLQKVCAGQLCECNKRLRLAGGESSKVYGRTNGEDGVYRYLRQAWELHCKQLLKLRTRPAPLQRRATSRSSRGGWEATGPEFTLLLHIRRCALLNPPRSSVYCTPNLLSPIRESSIKLFRDELTLRTTDSPSLPHARVKLLPCAWSAPAASAAEAQPRARSHVLAAWDSAHLCDQQLSRPRALRSKNCLP